MRESGAVSAAGTVAVRRALQLVWIGSSSTLQSLEAIAPLLEDVGRTIPGLQLKLISDRFMRFSQLAVVACPWSEPHEAEEIAAADVGISWMPDDLWSRGKCGLKVLQYMAAGLPVVANPVGVHTEMIQHGETGFLATTPAEWIEAIGTLSRDPERRERMGRAGRRLVETNYSVAVGAQALADAVRRTGNANAAHGVVRRIAIVQRVGYAPKIDIQYLANWLRNP